MTTLTDPQSSSPRPPCHAVAVVPAWAPIALTPRGTAAARLSEFQDAWAELDASDRARFAPWLNELLIDAVLSETT